VNQQIRLRVQPSSSILPKEFNYSVKSKKEAFSHNGVSRIQGFRVLSYLL